MLPHFPLSAPISLDFKDELHFMLSKTTDGVSEYTFANLYLFRSRYDYQISIDDNGALIIQGTLNGKKFFETPCSLPSSAVLKALLDTNDYWKCIPESILQEFPSLADDFGIEIIEDRDNFDYLYLKTDLAVLSGKKFHKKRNLVNAFLLAYPQNSFLPLTKDLVGNAVTVLEHWREDKGSDGDYEASREALDMFEELGLEGTVYYIKGKAAAYCLGEPLANGRIFGLHFEKGIDEYKGIYQWVNQSFAANLSDSYTYINREQDLGDEGMRQAKMTYRPCGFVKKFTGKK
ncbi:MAG: phosphatidylglycerol lysyltransferase domain-containing protein [Termitinemataceae bacterium]|nr:MAG: phosphatidylglycerol lysyltransferase domain-containing protein [Termitinemataceae bacterium]